MTHSILQSRKRLLLAWMAVLPWMAGCSKASQASDDSRLSKSDGIGMTLVVDAVEGAEMGQVVNYDDRGLIIYSSATVARHQRGILALSSGRIPLSTHAVWGRDRHYDFGHAAWYGGTILGDYTIPVAERIPDAVLHELRMHPRGNLRLKLRLKPDGVLFGWDIERTAPSADVSIFEMPGGDFAETRY